MMTETDFGPMKICYPVSLYKNTQITLLNFQVKKIKFKPCQH